MSKKYVALSEYDLYDQYTIVQKHRSKNHKLTESEFISVYLNEFTIPFLNIQIGKKQEEDAKIDIQDKRNSNEYKQIKAFVKAEIMDPGKNPTTQKSNDYIIRRLQGFFGSLGVTVLVFLWKLRKMSAEGSVGKNIKDNIVDLFLDLMFIIADIPIVKIMHIVSKSEKEYEAMVKGYHEQMDKMYIFDIMGTLVKFILGKFNKLDKRVVIAIIIIKPMLKLLSALYNMVNNPLP